VSHTAVQKEAMAKYGSYRRRKTGEWKKIFD